MEKSFQNYSYPKPNTIIQKGVKVSIKGLTSAAGKGLNGKKGVALEFLPDKGRWTIQLEDSGEQKSIQMKNLETLELDMHFCFFNEKHESAQTLFEDRLMLAGTARGKPAIAVYFPENKEIWNEETIQRESSLMGISPKVVTQLLAACEKPAEAGPNSGGKSDGM